MITSIDHIVITSENIEKTIYFYCNILGMTLGEYFVRDLNEKRICLKFGNQKINIHHISKPFRPHAKRVFSGTVDVCFISSLNIKEWQSLLKKNEITIELGPILQEGADSIIESIYIRDPDLNLIEIANKIQV